MYLYNVRQIIKVHHISLINTCNSAHNNTFSFYFHKLANCSGKSILVQIHHLNTTAAKALPACANWDAMMLNVSTCRPMKILHFLELTNHIRACVVKGRSRGIQSVIPTPAKALPFQLVPTWTQKCKIILLSSHIERLFPDDCSSASNPLPAKD